MTVLSRQELERSLSSNHIENLYLLVGAEGYLRDAAARQIADAALSRTALREFNEFSFSLLTESTQAVVAAAEQLPMMSQWRIVTVRDFAKLREADEQVLSNYVANPSPTTAMIFSTAELDKRKVLTRALFDSCTVVEFPALKDAEATAWARTHLRELNTSAAERVLNEVIRLVGTDVQTLSNELDKLASAAANTGSISMEMVDDLIGRSRELSNFELSDQLLARNRKRALETLYRLLEDGSEPVMLIGLLAGNYHRLALGKQLLTQGTPQDVFKNVSLPPFKRDAYIRTLKQLDMDRITRSIQLIAAADLAIKTSQATPRLQLEMLVCELAS
jgi:DNA polymerase-3 subunit delta